MSLNITHAAIQISTQVGVPILVEGSPGVGKSSTMEQLAKQLGVPMEIVIASIREPADFNGLPVVDGDGHVTMAPPKWAKRLKDAESGILFFDEISTAPPAVQAALLRVVLDRVVGEITLPEGIGIVAACNPPEEAAGGWDLAPPLANRFVHLDWKLESRKWIEGFTSSWPEPKAIRLSDNWKKNLVKSKSLVGSFINAKATALFDMPDNDSQRGKAWASPRTWDMASQMLAACMDVYGGQIISNPNDVLSRLICGCVGDGYGHEFVSYIQELDLPDPEEIIKDPDSLELPDRSDRAYAILSSISSAIVSNNTPDRWHSGFLIMENAVNQGKKDVAVMAVRSLLHNRPDDVYPPDSILAFKPIMKSAGLLGEG